MPDVHLRPLLESDEPAVFEMMRDPAAVRMAAFTARDPDDREAFAAHFQRLRTDPAVTALAVEADGALVGTVGAFDMEGEREVTYWIDRRHWGRGLATAALAQLLERESVRPIAARAAAANGASLHVLHRAGFEEVLLLLR